MNILAILRMGQRNGPAYLVPIAREIEPGELNIVRPAEPSTELSALPNANQINTSGGGPVVEVIKTLISSSWQAIFRRPVFIVSFSAYPYGAIAALVGRLFRIPFHVGFVGSDVEAVDSRPWLRRLLDGARLITVPGELIEDDLRAQGFRAHIQHLPHAINMAQFTPDNSERTIDCLFVGDLIDRKRVDVLIKTAGVARRVGADWRVMIVGDGPNRGQLEDLAIREDVGDQVMFTGYLTDPSPMMRRARTVVMPSHLEGVPFALIEGAACGAIPIATPVGDIATFIEDGENGFLLHSVEPEGVYGVISALLDNPELEERVRRSSLALITQYDIGSAQRIWRALIADLDHPSSSRH